VAPLIVTTPPHALNTAPTTTHDMGKRKRGVSRKGIIKVGEEKLKTDTFASRKKLRDEGEERMRQIISGKKPSSPSKVSDK
jgi:hypothetical protein